MTAVVVNRLRFTDAVASPVARHERAVRAVLVEHAGGG